MNEQDMLEEVQDALTRIGIGDELVAAGLFFPRGHTGGAFVGGLLGETVGGTLGGIGEDVGLVAGAIGGQHAADAASSLPERMLVAVSATAVYGFDTRREGHRVPTDLIFQLPRSQLEVQVHPRVNVRVVGLIDTATDSRVKLEGERLPGFHASKVIDALRS
jgi:hypothetical protein